MLRLREGLSKMFNFFALGAMAIPEAGYFGYGFGFGGMFIGGIPMPTMPITPNVTPAPTVTIEEDDSEE